MAGRLWRWTCYGLGLGLLPLLLASVARVYYLERAPTLVESLAGGDALLVAVAWSSAALLDLPSARLVEWVRLLVGSLAISAALAATVAYACLTTDSVTGRVQTRGQARFLTVVSVVTLVAAATCGATTATARPRDEEAGR